MMIIVKNNNGIAMGGGGGAQIPSAPGPHKKHALCKTKGQWKTCDPPTGKILATPLRNTVYVVIFAVVYLNCEFRESDLAKNFHFNLCLFTVMKTPEKS